MEFLSDWCTGNHESFATDVISSSVNKYFKSIQLISILFDCTTIHWQCLCLNSWVAFCSCLEIMMMGVRRCVLPN